MPIKSSGAKGNSDKLKSVISHVLQGLAYRAASEKELLAIKDLPEAALVMFARENFRLPLAAADLRLIPEASPKKLEWSNPLPKALARAHIDLVISRVMHGVKPTPVALLEFKRGFVISERVRNDIQRLKTFKASADSKCQAYLVLVGAGCPNRFVSDNGHALRRPEILAKRSIGANVVIRRICKALPTTKLRAASGVWAIALEVLG
jgi:hypothetical protein